jgi:hypothetical protein
MAHWQTACHRMVLNAQIRRVPSALFGAGFDSLLRLCCWRAADYLELAMDRLRRILS